MLGCSGYSRYFALLLQCLFRSNAICSQRGRMWTQNRAIIPCVCIYCLCRISILDNGNLRIWNVSVADGGLYTCVARNQFGSASSSGTVTVKGTSCFLPLLKGSDWWVSALSVRCRRSANKESLRKRLVLRAAQPNYYQ